MPLVFADPPSKLPSRALYWRRHYGYRTEQSYLRWLTVSCASTIGAIPRYGRRRVTAFESFGG
jgi:hypothetical protein